MDDWQTYCTTTGRGMIMEDVSNTYPRWMYVGNRIVNRSRYGKNPVLIVRVGDGRFWDERGYSWKYGKPVNE